MLKLAVTNPVVTLSPAQIYVRLCLRAYGMALLQAGGVALIAHGSWLAGLTGFLISYNWLGAAQDGALYRIPYSRMAYGVGGGLGTLTVIAVAWWRA